MTRFTCSPRLLFIVSSLALGACELPTKLGNLSDSGSTEDSATTAATATSSAGTDSATSAGTTDDTPENSDTWWTSTSSFETSGTTLIDTTDDPPQCAAFDEDTCEAAGCQAYYGIAYDFPGCSPEPTYLGCTDPKECDTAETDFCREGTDEAYKLDTTCVPPGFIACEPPTVAFCGSCEALDEAACLAEPTDCRPIYGAPQIEVDGEVCTDYDNQDFLLCIANGGACPPFIPLVCKIGMPEKVWESPSGCVPAGFETCDGQTEPSCL